MDIDQLRTLLAIADAGSLSGAARRMGHPKSTVAKRIKQLETLLGLALLDRGQRQVRLSDSAYALLEHARDIVARGEELEQVAKFKPRSVSGRIRLTVPTLLGQTLLPDTLARFAARYNEVELSVAVEDRYADLVGDGYDCAIRIGSGDDPNLVRRKLGTSTLVLVAHVDLHEAVQMSHPSELASLPAVGFEPSTAEQVWRLRHGDYSFDLRPQIGFTFRSLPAIARVLKSYPAIALLPRFLVQQYLSAGELAHICPGWQGETHDVSVMFPSRAYMPERLRCLIDHLVREFETFDL